MTAMGGKPDYHPPKYAFPRLLSGILTLGNGGMCGSADSPYQSTGRGEITQRNLSERAEGDEAGG
jgi:hypothetical protein